MMIYLGHHPKGEKSRRQSEIQRSTSAREETKRRVYNHDELPARESITRMLEKTHQLFDPNVATSHKKIIIFLQLL